MNTGSYEQSIAYLKKNKPKLVRTFFGMAGSLQASSYRDADLYSVATRFTLASERLYIAPDIIKIAIRRKEPAELSTVLLCLSRRRTALALAVLRAYPAMRFNLSDVSEEILVQTGASILKLEKPERALTFCLSASQPEQCMVFLRLFGAMAAFSPKAVADFLLLYEKVRQTMSWTSMKQWLERGIGMVTGGRTEDGVRYLLGQSKESRQLLDMRFALLDDIKNILHIYCGSIGDQTFGIQSTAISSVGIEEVYCDGQSVFLPPTLSLFDTIEENEAAYTAIAAVQAAAVAFDTFSLDLENLDFMNEIRERYALIPPDIMESAGKQYQNSARMVRERATGEIEALFDGERTLLLLQTPHEQFFYLFPAPDLARELFILIELCRIEAVLGARYNGLKADFTALHNTVLARQPARTLPADRSSQFEYMIDVTIRIALGDLQHSIRGAQRIDRQIAQITGQINGIRSEKQTVYDSARITFDIYNLLYENYPVVLWCRENDIRTLFNPYLEMTICPEVVFDISPELFIGVKERPIFEDLEEPEEREIDLTSLTQSERKAFELKQAILSGDIRIYRYPEYDVQKGDYKQKYCTLYESVLQAGDAGWFGKVLSEHQRIYKKLKKRFLMMEPEELQISRRWLQGDEIHLGDAMDYITDLFRGECPDEKIYLKRTRNIRDIAAAILIDASSSTNEPVGGTTVLQIEKTALALLASVLSVIGDTFGIYSFFSMGRNNIFFSIAKDFDEPWNETVQSRIESIEANAGNRDGCAVRHVTERLLDRPEKTKLLLMLSDGIPADAEYGDGVGETGEYAIEDTRKAILEARIKGIIPYCITIDRRARDYTPHLYGEYHFTVLDDVTQLPEKLSKLYLRITK